MAPPARPRALWRFVRYNDTMIMEDKRVQKKKCEGDIIVTIVERTDVFHAIYVFCGALSGKNSGRIL
jgi:hypothetical protein